MVKNFWILSTIAILFQFATIAAIFKYNSAIKNHSIQLVLTPTCNNLSASAKVLTEKESLNIVHGPNFIKNRHFHKLYAAIEICITNKSAFDYCMTPQSIKPAIEEQETIIAALEQDTSALPLLISLGVPVGLIKGLNLAFFPSMLVGLTLLGTSTALYNSEKTTKTLNSTINTSLLNTKTPTLISANTSISALIFIKKSKLKNTVSLNLVQQQPQDL